MPDDATIVEGDAGFIGMASRLNPLQLQPGMVQYCENMRLDRGVAQTRKGAKRLADDISAGVLPLYFPFTLGLDKTITSLTFSSPTVTATITAHGYTTGQKLDIRGATQLDYNGTRAITVLDANTFTYDIAGSPTSPATGAVIANDGPVLQTSYAGGIYAACVFSNPNVDDAREYIALASDDKAYLWRDGCDLITKTYPTSADEIVEDGDKVSIIQAFNRLYVFREAAQYGSAKNVFSITRSGAVATVSLPNHGMANGQLVRITGASPIAYNGTVPITYVDANTFTYPVLSSLASVATGAITAEAGTMYASKPVSTGGITVSGSAATVRCVSHGYPVGATVRITGSAVPAFDGIEYEVASASANSFTVQVPVGTLPDTLLTASVRRVKPALYWDGDPSTNFVRAERGVHAVGITYRHMASVGWAAYINNRLWLPDGRDTVAISDVLDPDTFDPFFQTFRANQGSSDYIVGIHAWVEGQALVFMRRSIWLATLKQDFNGSEWDVDSAVSNLTLLTDEVGCVARKSIQTAGQYVFFLSDAGIYRLDSRLDLKLRGDTRPLSDPIADQLDGLNASAASKATAAWFNNRYYIAVPTGGADYNNTLFIYNALNEAWESRDSFASAMQLDELLVSTYQNRSRLFSASLAGKLFVLEELEEGDDAVNILANNATIPIVGTLLTRRYGFGTLNQKRILRTKVNLKMPAASSLEADAITTDYDKEVTVATLVAPLEEDYTLKAPIRMNAVYVDLRARTTAGRPSIRSITVEAARSANNSTLSRTLN